MEMADLNSNQNTIPNVDAGLKSLKNLINFISLKSTKTNLECPIQKVGIQLIIFLLLSFYLSLIIMTILTKITYLFFPHKEIN